MIKTILPLLLLMCVQEIFSQGYKYVEPGKQWYYEPFSGPFKYVSTMSRDSVLLGGKHYFRKASVTDSGQPLGSSYWREADGKVYQYRANGPDVLIYDWTLEKGDTLHKIDLFGYGFSIVDSMREQIIDPGKGRKIWYLSLICSDDDYRNYTIIEGLGATQAEFADRRCYVFESRSILQCVGKENDLQYSINQNCNFGKHTSLTQPIKQWVCLRKNTSSSSSIYTRYQFKKFDANPDNNRRELYSTVDKQGDNNWQKTGQIFQDSLGKIFEFIDNKPYTLFDFTLSKGDTFYLEFPNEPKTALLVDSTDTMILLDNLEYKRLYLSCPTVPGLKLTWVVGVGDITHFYQYRHLCYGKPDFNLTLTCYYYNYNLYYHSINATLCNLKSAAEDEPKSTAISAIPNPTTGLFSLKIEKPIKYTIRSLGGIVCQTGSILPDELINISDLIPGMYVLSALDDDSRLLSHIKLIKQ